MEPSNILKIESLNEGWRDKDDVLLHACFQVLSDFVEKEMLPQDYPDWNGMYQTRKARKEIEELYAWWQEWKNSEAAKTDAPYDEKWYYKENQMLKRVIDVRRHLWT